LNDTMSTEVSIEDVLNENPYCYFYTRID
jgi:hypothetical protein